MPEATQKKKRRKTPLSRDLVLQRAVKLADKSGIEGLSMRKLAQALRVEAMSLYNHVKNKDDVLDGMVEIVAAEVHVPVVGADWRAQMDQRARSAHAMMMKHRWAAGLMMSRINIGPVVLRYVDATLGCLREAGFSYPMADHVWNALDAFIYGFTLHALNFPFEQEEYAEVAEEYMPQLPADEFPYLTGLSLEVMQKRHDGVQDFSFGLNILLDGFAQHLSPD